MTNVKRRDIEAECLVAFEQVLKEANLEVSGRGYGAANRFDPSFELVGQQRFQFGDLRVDLDDRIVIVEVESGGGLTNLVKYWPFVASVPKPILLLHVFGQNSANEYVSHLKLWDFTWAKIRNELKSVQLAGRLHAQRYQFTYGDPIAFDRVSEDFRRCVTEDLSLVVASIFENETKVAH